MPLLLHENYPVVYRRSSSDIDQTDSASIVIVNEIIHNVTELQHLCECLWKFECIKAPYAGVESATTQAPQL
jgi:hypothetical protein